MFNNKNKALLFAVCAVVFGSYGIFFYFPLLIAVYANVHIAPTLCYYGQQNIQVNKIRIGIQIFLFFKGIGTFFASKKSVINFCILNFLNQ